MSSQLRMTIYAALATIATATSLTAVFSSSAWVVPVIGGIVLVAASCALIRASPLPSAFEPITAAVAVLLWVTALYAHHQARLGFIPGRTAFRHLSRVVQHGFDEIHSQPAPAPAHHGLVMLTVVGVAAIALVVDLMVVTLRRAALAGLPLLALFTVSAATGKHGVNLIWFVVAAGGYLVLLYVDNREKVARWGAAVGTGSQARPASAWSTDPAAGIAPASLGRRVGVMAIAFGVLVPFLIPGLHTGIDNHTSGSGNGSGNGSRVVADPIVSVASFLQNHQNYDVLSYTPSKPPRGYTPGYLRLTSLNRFDGVRFEAPGLDSRVVAGPALVAAPPGTAVTTSYSILPNLDLHWLPLQTTAVGVNIHDPWFYDATSATVFSQTSTAGQKYTARSVAYVPTRHQLLAVGKPDSTTELNNDLTVPTDVRKAVEGLTALVTAPAHHNRYRMAMAIQNYLTSAQFHYDTSVHYTGHDPLREFLSKKRGFCQQFATAMAVMARLSGIPSRVAVGFTPGKQQPNGSYLVGTHDAHAWPELWFQGYGWLAFEPTPRADGQAITPPYAQPHHAAGNSGGRNKNNDTITSRGVVKPPATPQGDVSTTSGSGPLGGGPLSLAGLGTILLGLILLCALAAPGASRAITRRRRGHQLKNPDLAASAAWAELRDTAIDLRAPWDDGCSPRQLAAGLAASLSPGGRIATRESLNRLAHIEERARYARVAGPVEATPADDLVVVRTALRADRTRRQLLSATVMPRSTTAIVRNYLRRVAASIDRFGQSISQTVRRTRLPRRT
jgi:hypothetical protein